MTMADSVSVRWLLCVILLTIVVGVKSTREKLALIAFLSHVPHSHRLEWNKSSPVCDWVGVGCDPTRSYVYSLRLPAVGLVGPIPENTIGRLNRLRILSLRSNAITGSIPQDISNLTALRGLYLQNNKFTGSIPITLTGLTRLARLDLSHNSLTGSIPAEIENLTRLTGLFLENNGLTGQIPSFNSSSLVEFNVSNNNLAGSIPKSLSKFPESSFSGNIDLCGDPLPPCETISPPPAASPTPAPTNSPSAKNPKNPDKLSPGEIAGISISAATLVILPVLILLFLCVRGRDRAANSPKLPDAASGGEAGTSSSKDDDVAGASLTEAERNKLVFFGGGANGFDLEDLLRASAEVLGKGGVGTSYKAVLEEGTTVVVKRLKDLSVSKREFEGQIEELGRIRHHNVVPIRAFYFSKDEKLLVTDFVAGGSLSAFLHGSRGSRREALDWETRMRIGVSAARGLAHLHVSGKIVHGNIKSSNILLRPDHESCISDFGLSPMFGSLSAPNRVAGYRAPEVVETRRVTFKSDVYSFGVVLLELLTGKAPNQALLGEEGIDLPRWVQSVVREEWTAEVFDVELRTNHNIDEMVQLLQIAMGCVAMVPDQRPDMIEVVRMIEEVGRVDPDDDVLRQSSDDPSRESDGQTPPRS